MDSYYIICRSTPRTFILYQNRLEFKVFIMFQQDIFTFPPGSTKNTLCQPEQAHQNPVTGNAVYALSN